MEHTIHERLAVIEEVVLRLEQRLLGNGQPGELALLQQRVRRIESWFWRLVGAASLLFALLELLKISPPFSIHL